MLTEPSADLLVPDPPEDLDQFWFDAVGQAEGAPLDFRRSGTQDYPKTGFQVESLEFRGVKGNTLHGWIASPEGARALPAFLWIAPYGRWSMPPNDYGTRDGMVSLSFNFFGESAFHEEEYVPRRGYFSEGAGSPETFVFREMLQNAVIATRVLEAQPEVDEAKLAAMGLSQGGGMAVWLGAWCSRIRCVAADFPFLGAMRWVLAHRVHRYPLKELAEFMDYTPLGREVVGHTLRYYDTLNQATRCDVPTLVTLGLKDPAVKPEQVRAIFEALPGEKELVELEWGHDWHPDMVERNRDWLAKHLV